MANRKSDHKKADIEPESLVRSTSIASNVPEATEHVLEPSIATKRTLPVKRVFLKISFLLLGEFLAQIDDTFTITAYNQIASDFGNSDHAYWIVALESLFFTVSLSIYGFLSDKYGSKKPILAAYALWIIGLVITCLAPYFWVVVLGRVICGIGGAGTFTMTSIVIVEHAGPADVAILRSYAMVVAQLGRNTGPVIGGLLTDAIGWRKAFLCQVPGAALCFLVTGWFFDSGNIDREDNERRPLIRPEARKPDTSIDLPGIALFTSSLLCFVLTVTQLKDGFNLRNPLLVVPTILFLFISVAFYFRERSVGEQAFIQLSFFNSILGPQFLVQFLWYSTHYSLLTNVPTYFTRVENAKITSTALHIIPISASTMIANLLAGRIIQKFQRYKVLAHTGIAIGTLGFLLIAFLWRGRISIGESLIVMLPAFGTGLLNGAAFVAISLEGAANRRGSIIGFFFLLQGLGGLVGISISSTVINAVYEQSLLRNSPDVTDRHAIIKHILRDAHYVFRLSQGWQQAAMASFVNGFSVWILACGAITVVLQPLYCMVREKAVI